MKSLRKKNSSYLEKSILKNNPRYQFLLASSQVRKLSNIDDLDELTTLDGVVLIFISAWEKAKDRFQSSPDDLASLLLVFARYLYGAYQIHIQYDTNYIKKMKTHKAAKEWVFSMEINNALKYLQIPFSTEEIKKAKDVLVPLKSNSTLSRQIRDGVQILHGELCLLVNIKPTPKSYKSQPKEKAQTTKTRITNADGDEFIKPLLQGKSGYQVPENLIQKSRLVEASLEKEHAIQPWEPPLEQIKASNRLRYSPLLCQYCESNEFKRSFNLLWERNHQLPAIRQVVIQMIWEALDKTTLNQTQRLLAIELLKDLPCWGLGQETPRKFISYQDATIYGYQQPYRSELSLLIDQLLSCGLLLVDDLKLKIAQPVINDFALTLGYLKKFGVPALLPQGSEMNFSQWLFWLMDHLIADNRLEDAGRFLYRVQGSFPGYSSNSWREIADVLAFLPDFALREPFIWIILNVANAALDQTVYLWEASYIAETNDLFQRVPPTSNSEIPKEILENKNKFTAGIKQYLAFQENSGNFSFRTLYWRLYELILAKPPKNSAENKWLKVHFISDLRHLSPDEYNSVIKNSTSPFRKTLMKQAKTSDAILKLAVCELFALQEDSLFLEILDFEKDYLFLPPEIITRGTILKLGVQFPAEYGNWI